ncbi:MAG: hypothetical protein CMJ48_10895 [Planctomycetaceae bacterium]|nr:hypothetical protein [Planctomycetaceae bacterium]
MESFRDCECCSNSPAPRTSESRRPIERESHAGLEFPSQVVLAESRTASHSAASDRGAWSAHLPPHRVLHCSWLT